MSFRVFLAKSVNKINWDLGFLQFYLLHYFAILNEINHRLCTTDFYANSNELQQEQIANKSGVSGSLVTRIKETVQRVVCFALNLAFRFKCLNKAKLYITYPEPSYITI